MRKYEFTGETLEFEGHTLHRIQAVRDFGDVKAGDIGGWIEREENLSHEGTCWVYGNAKVFGNAKVLGNARVSGDAQVFDGARISGRAHVCGNVRVFGDADVFDNALVSGNAQVYDSAVVSGKAFVYGHACVYENARVFQNATVYWNAQVHGCAWVYGNARVGFGANIQESSDYVSIHPIGSEDGTLTAFYTRDGSVMCVRGCFEGTLEEFERAVREKHGDNQYGREYMLAIQMIRERFGIGV